MWVLVATSPAYSQTGVWTWMKGGNPYGSVIYGTQGVPNANNIPGGRARSMRWTDSTGNFWLYGGEKYFPLTSPCGDINCYYDQLWQYNVSTNMWTWVRGNQTPEISPVYSSHSPSVLNNPGSREYGATWTDKQGNMWLFGGVIRYLINYYEPVGDLWKLSSNLWTWVAASPVNGRAVYGIKGVASPSNTPGARNSSQTWVDSAGNLWLFGGGSRAGSLNDLWKYNTSTNQWTWINGDTVSNQLPVYGIKGISADSNNPGGRFLSLGWTDKSDNLWLWGGVLSYSGDSRNDLWKYNIVTNQWTWIRGSKTFSFASYGQLGISSPTNDPGAGLEQTSWTDTTGNFWLLSAGRDNVLWKYTIATNEWTWINGSISPLVYSYGLQGVPSCSNLPPERSVAVGWTDKSNQLWLWGGGNDYNDLWRYTPDISCSTLPLNLLSFIATLQENAGNKQQILVNLCWKSENELSFDYYKIERSNNGKDFINIKRQKAKGKVGMNEYSDDDNVSQFTSYVSQVYYRLKMINKDGSFIYSKIAKVEIKIPKSNVIIYPNPTTSSIILQLIGTSSKADVQIFDMAGRVLYKRSISELEWSKGQISIPMNNFAQDIYVVEVKKNDKLWSIKVVKK